MTEQITYPKVVKTFLEIVPINNPSKQEDELTLWLVDQLTLMGVNSIIQDNFGNVIARIDSNIDNNTNSIMFIAHLDSVQPCKDIKAKIEPFDNDYLITSEGDTILSSDDKAGISGIIEAVKEVKNGNYKYPNIELIFTVQEEIGLLGAKALDISQLQSKMAYAVDAEAPVGTIITQGPSQKKFELDFFGKSSHAGMAPEKGINSIILAANFLSDVTTGRIDNATTSNIGLIEGGVANNVVPEHTRLQGEVRSLYESKLDGILASYNVSAQKAICNNTGASFTFKDWFVYHSFFINVNTKVVQLAMNACKNINIDPVIKEIGSGSDANIFNYNDIETVILGTGFRKSHSLEEYITFSQLELLCDLIVNIIIEAGQ